MATAMAVAMSLPSCTSLTRRHFHTKITWASSSNPPEERANQSPMMNPRTPLNLGVKAIKRSSNSGNAHQFLQLGLHQSRSSRTLLAKSATSSSNGGVPDDEVAVAPSLAQNVSINFLSFRFLLLILC